MTRLRDKTHRLFRQPYTVFRYLMRQVGVFRRVHHIHTAAQDGDCSSVQRGLMRRRVYASGKARDDDITLGPKIRRQCARHTNTQ